MPGFTVRHRAGVDGLHSLTVAGFLRMTMGKKTPAQCEELVELDFIWFVLIRKNDETAFRFSRQYNTHRELGLCSTIVRLNIFA